jgi:cytidylate kinase
MPLITISQDYGSHGYYAAQKVAQELQLELYDDETLREAAGKLRIKTDNHNALKEQVPGFFDRHMGVKPDVYLDVLQGVVYHMSSENRGVIVGHGSQVLLKDFGCALHVRIISPVEKRVRYFMEKQGIEENLARKIVRSKDDEFKGFFRYAFNMDINDPLLYDLVINTDKIGIETVISHIVELAKSNEITECSIGALAIMKCRALELRIHAKLIQSGVITTGFTVEVTEPGRALVHGFINNKDDRQKIIEVLDTISDLNKVEVDITVAPLFG